MSVNQNNASYKGQVIGGLITITVVILANVVLNGGIIGCQRLVHSKQYAELDILKPKIKTLKDSIASRESELSAQGKILELEESTIEEMKSNLDEVKKEYPDLVMPKEKERAFNELVSRYNSRVDENNSHISAYNLENELYKKEINEVNGYIDRANKLGEEIGPTYTVAVGVRSRSRR